MWVISWAAKWNIIICSFWTWFDLAACLPTSTHQVLIPLPWVL